jgi:hypothetical protein
MKSPAFFCKLVPWICFLLPFLVLLWLQRSYAFRNLNWDDWGLVQDRFPGADLTPNWDGLFKTASGHSIPWLRFSVIPAVLMAAGDTRYVLLVSLALALGTGLLLRKLAGATLGQHRTEVGLLLGLAVACPIFSQVWLWWICWPIFMPFFCLLVGIHLLRNQPFGWGRLAAVLGVAWIASQSQAAGAMVWLALFPSLRAFWQDQPRRKQIIAGAILAVVGLVILRPFLMDSADNGEGTNLLQRLPRLISYGLTLLGGSLGQGWLADSVPPSQILGALLLLGLPWVAWQTLRRVPLHADVAAWFSVASFGFFSAVAIAFGRYWLPSYQALAGRYLLLTYPLWLGLYFAVRSWQHQTQPVPTGNRRVIWASISVVLIVALLNTWGTGYREIRLCHAQHQAGGAPLNFCRIFPDHPALKQCYPDPPVLKAIVDTLDHGQALYGFSLYPDAALSNLGRTYFLRANRGGRLTQASTTPAGIILLDGFAYLDEVDRPADLIILTWETADNPKPRIFEIIPTSIRSDFYRSGDRFRKPENFTGWHAALRPEQLPAGSGKLRAWAYDNESKRVYNMRNAALITDGKLVKFDEEVPPKVLSQK